MRSHCRFYEVCGSFSNCVKCRGGYERRKKHDTKPTRRQ